MAWTALRLVPFVFPPAFGRVTWCLPRALHGRCQRHPYQLVLGNPALATPGAPGRSCAVPFTVAPPGLLPSLALGSHDAVKHAW